jgi:hypothetical protein
VAGSGTAGELEKFKAAFGSKVGDDTYNTDYDYDDNGKIDIFDAREARKAFQDELQGVRQAFGTKSGSAAYQKVQDYDHNGKIDVFDLRQLRSKWRG